MNAITIDALTKTFKPGWPGQAPVQALQGLSLSVNAGEIFGFLGPNGSGKTTTLKILLGLTRPTGGHAEVLGNPAGDVDTRRRIGFLPEGPYFYDYLTAEEFLTFYGELAGLRGSALRARVTAMLDLVGLRDARTRQLRKFSKGMLQRVGLAQAIIHEPELVILDEPMSGLDPIGRKEIRDLILSLRDQGRTVFFSTHIIPDVEMICDRVAIIVKGRLVAAGTVEELMATGDTHSIEVVCEGLSPDRLRTLAAGAGRVLQQGRRSLIVLPDADHLEQVIKAIRDQGGKLVSVVPVKRSLEELFVEESEKKA